MAAAERSNRAGRRSSDADLAVVIERLDNLTDLAEATHKQAVKTNGRVSELEVKERIRKDREEQKAIRDAAAEAAKYRVEQQAEHEAEREAEDRRHRITWREMRLAAVVAATPALLLELIRLAVTHHF